MSKFIVSDLHGNGNVYNSIMKYLENVSKEEEVTLYINGDLIDRGPDSSEMLLDVIERQKNGPFKVEYLAGSHELLMHQYFLDKKNNTKKYYEDWFDYGGMSTYYGLEDILGNDEKMLYVSDFISNLKIFNEFEEKINGKNIVLVHASSIMYGDDTKDLTLKDNSDDVYVSLLARPFPSYFPFRCKLDNKNYFTIAGHTPNDSKDGFKYYMDENLLNIDGGSSRYVIGFFDQDHVPLVEVNDGYLKVLTFNNNNEIINGCFIDHNGIFPFSKIEEEHNKKYLDNTVKVKKVIKNEDGVVFYN